MATAEEETAPERFPSILPAQFDIRPPIGQGTARNAWNRPKVPLSTTPANPDTSSGGGLLLPFSLPFGDRNVAVERKVREAFGRAAG